MSKDSLDNIEHIVVLMMENRSFDNVLGWLYDPDNKPPFDLPPQGAFHGVNSSMSNPDEDGGRVYVSRNTSDFTAPFPDPNEPYEFVYSQLFDVALNNSVKRPPPNINVPNSSDVPNMQGFVKDYANAIQKAQQKQNKNNESHLYNQPNAIMDCFVPEALPVINGLAQAYGVCDHWFSSVPTQTFPNRSFIHAATSSGNVYNTWETGRYCWNLPGVFINDSKTIYNLLDENISWKVYHGGPLFLCNTLITQRKLWDYWDTEHFSPFREPSLFNQHTFFKDLEEHKLPSYSFIEPNMIYSKKYGPENDMHPAYAITEHGPPTDVRYGDKLIYDIFDALRSSKRYWDKTLFVITFDEHGGCFDHVPPKSTVSPDGKVLPYTNGWNAGNGFDFKRYGVRVPAVVVSPWINEGSIFNTVFDHTSVIKTVAKKWLNGQHLTDRDLAANDLGLVLNSGEARTDTVHITKPMPPNYEGSADKPLSEMQQHTVLAASAMARYHKLKPKLSNLDSTEKVTAYFDACEEKLRSP